MNYKLFLAEKLWPWEDCIKETAQLLLAGLVLAAVVFCCWYF